MDTITMWSYDGWKDPHITAIFICCIVIGCAMNFSIATITVGMLAFNDVAPTGLFIGGVVVNTVGSVTYCVVKYHEMKKKSSYQDLEEAGKDAETTPPPEDRPAPPESYEAAPTSGEAWPGGPGAHPQVMTDQDVLEMQREHLQKETCASSQPVSDSYLGVWRSVRHLQFMKKELLVHNMEQQSP